MAKKGLFTTLALLLASTLVSAGGLEPGTASGTVEVGGYADVLYANYDETESTFILGHVCLDVTAALSDDVVVAAEIEWANAEPNALSTNDVDGQVVCAYIDFPIVEAVALRAGKFLVPFNVYNTSLYPADVAKLASVPFMNQSIVPSKWAETGIQLHGEIDTGTDAGLNYVVYLVNGLEATDTLAADGSVLVAAEEQRIQSMKNNDIDVSDSDKAIGGRLGLTTAVGFEAGLSGYKGAYTTDGAQDITMVGVDASYTYEAFELRAELVNAEQEGRSVEDMDGFYLQGAYKFLDKYEAVARYEEIDLTGDAVDRIAIGGNYTITDDLVLRVAYEWNDASEGDGVVGQLAVRF